ncbi:NAD(P)-dependent dehydrogenase (short-subunit alcohol dehydrogenase family) [Bradyrhizobium sp. LM3.2]
MQKRNATVAVIGAGDYIGSEIAKKFASEGFTVFAGRRDGAKLEPLVKEIEKAGGEIHARALDARKEDEIISFLGDADKHAPLEVCIFNVGANVNFPILDTTERVFRKVWEMACYSGFLAGREAARLMLPRGRGQYLLHRCDGEFTRRKRLCGLRQRQVRPAGGRASRGARVGPEEHSRCTSDHRFRGRHGMGTAAADRGAWSERAG